MNSLHNRRVPRHGGSLFAGFTMIELMVVTLVVAILAAVAYPSFAAYRHRSHRAQLHAAVAALQQAQEEWRTEHASYTSDLSTATGLGFGPDATHHELPGGRYRITVADATAAGYEIRAEAIGSQTGDSECLHLMLTVRGADMQHASGRTASLENAPTANARCWNL